jgi:hypothetical protein
MRVPFVILFVLLVPGFANAQKTCDYAGQSYSVGASICECPGVKAENVDWEHDNSHIISRWLTCNAEQVWEDSKTFAST